ncbi:hypothetical protein L1887_58657 [Cichorium endivia]|nr:hypothetical protein L1887_58657 [Cichorium endivia]
MGRVRIAGGCEACRAAANESVVATRGMVAGVEGDSGWGSDRSFVGVSSHGKEARRRRLSGARQPPLCSTTWEACNSSLRSLRNSAKPITPALDHATGASSHPTTAPTHHISPSHPPVPTTYSTARPAQLVVLHS